MSPTMSCLCRPIGRIIFVTVVVDSVSFKIARLVLNQLCDDRVIRCRARL